MNKYEAPSSTLVKLMLENTILQDSYNEDNNQRMRRYDDDYF